MADQHGEPQQAESGHGTGDGAQRPKARDLNKLIRYTMWSVFRLRDRGAFDQAGRPALAAEVTDLCEQAAGKGGGEIFVSSLSPQMERADYPHLPRRHP